MLSIAAMFAALLALCVVVLVVAIPLAVGGHAFVELRPGSKLAVQVAWWAVTVAAMLGASAWWRDRSESAFRTVLAILACIAMPGLGVAMAVRTVLPPRGAVPNPWYARPARRAAAGAGALRNARLRRD